MVCFVGEFIAPRIYQASVTGVLTAGDNPVNAWGGVGIFERPLGLESARYLCVLLLQFKRIFSSRQVVWAMAHLTALVVPHNVVGIDRLGWSYFVIGITSSKHSTFKG
jgi:hypothetical protein